MSAQLSRTSNIRRWYRWLLFAVILSAVIWFIARNFKQVSQYSFEFNRLLLAFSFLSVLCAFLFRFGVWVRLASLFGLDAPLRRAGRAYFLSILGRYIPGKVGLALVRIEAYSDYPSEKVIMATGMELVAALTAALLLAFIGLALSPSHFPSYLRWVALLCIAPLLAALSPPVLRRVSNAVLRLAGREKIEIRFPFKANLALVGLYTIPGFLHGCGLFLLINSLSHISTHHYLAVTGAYYTASLAGLIAFFAPGGLGVREGVLFLVLPALVGRETAIVAAILIRLVTIVAEVVLAAGFTAIAGIKAGSTQEKQIHR